MKSFLDLSSLKQTVESVRLLSKVLTCFGGLMVFQVSLPQPPLTPVLSRGEQHYENN